MKATAHDLRIRVAQLEAELGKQEDLIDRIAQLETALANIANRGCDYGSYQCAPIARIALGSSVEA
jgi:hypothetical protein